MDDIISWCDSCVARVSPSVSTSLVAYYASIIPAFSQFSAVFYLKSISKFNYYDPKSLSLEHHLGCDCQHTACDSTQTFNCKKAKKLGCTLFLYLSDLFHSFLQDCTFVRLDIEVVDVIEVGKN